MSDFNIDNKLVKKAGEDQPLTPEQAKEWLKCKNDRYYFFENYCYIQGARGRELFKPRQYQKRMIDTSTNNRFTIGLSGRQSGKSTTFSVDIVHDVVFNRDYRVFITSYKNANVLDFMSRIRFVYENLPWWMKPATVTYNKFSMIFDNGSSIRSGVTSESTGRGLSLDRLIVDELAFVKQQVAEEFIGSLLPSISADGESSRTRLNIVSTPKGTAGAFAQLWFGAVSGVNGFEPVEVKYEEIPGRTPEFEANMVNKIGRDKFDQEFRNVFIGSGGTLINSRIMESLPTKEPIRTFGDLDIFVNSFSGRKLAMAVDVGEGILADNHCIQIIDIDTFEQVAEFANNSLNQTQFTKEIIRIITMIFNEGASDLFYTVEANGLGIGVINLLINTDDRNLSRATLLSDVNQSGTTTRFGMLTTHKSKLDGCMKLKDLVEHHRITLNSKKLITELKFFIKQGNSFAAEKGTNDDRVMGMVILMNVLKQVAFYEDKVHETVNEVNTTDDDFYGIY